MNNYNHNHYRINYFQIDLTPDAIAIALLSQLDPETFDIAMFHLFNGYSINCSSTFITLVNNYM